MNYQKNKHFLKHTTMFECNASGLSETQCFFINAGLYLGYLLIIVTTLAAIVWPIIHLIKNPVNIKSTFIGIGVLVLVFIISYTIASDEVLESYGNITTTESKYSGVELISFYILFAIAIISILFSELSKYFTK